MVVELGLGGVRGHEEIDRKKEGEVLERSGKGNVGEELRDEEGKNREEEADGNDWLSFYKAPQFYGASWKSGSGWNRMRIFFHDLADYGAEKRGIKKEEFWRKMEQWKFHGKVIRKNGSYIRLNQFLWDEGI